MRFSPDTCYLVGMTNPRLPEALCGSRDFGSATRNKRQVTCVDCAFILELREEEL